MIFHNIKSRYKIIGLLTLSLAIYLIVFQQTIFDIVTAWTRYDESMGHGFLVLCVCVYLLHKTAFWKYGEETCVELRWVPSLILCCIVWGITDTVDIDIIQQFVLPLIVIQVVLVIFGYRFGKRLILPVAFIYFAIPVWDYLNESLVSLTSFAVLRLVKLTSITAFIEGNSIFIPSGEVLIASGCSGLRYFIVGLFLSALSSYLFFHTLTWRLSIIICSVVLSLVANWTRVYVITLVAYYSEMQSPLVKNHETLGWVIFLVFMLPLFFANNKYGVDKVNEDDSNLSSKVTGVSLREGTALVICLFSMYSGLLVTTYNVENKRSMDVSSLIKDSQVVQGWKIISEDRGPIYNPGIKNTEYFLKETLRKGDDIIEIYKYLYLQSGEKGELLPYFHGMFNSNKWVLVSSEDIHVKSTAGHRKFRILLLRNKRTQRQIITAHSFEVGGYSTGSYYKAKLFQIPAILFGKPYATLELLAIECRDDCKQANEQLSNYLDNMSGLLN